jgi:hypothetical protein
MASCLPHAQAKAKLAFSLMLLSGGLAATALSSQLVKEPMHTSKLTGQEWVEELLDGHDRRFYNQFGMKKPSAN